MSYVESFLDSNLDSNAVRRLYQIPTYIFSGITSTAPAVSSLTIVVTKY